MGGATMCEWLSGEGHRACHVCGSTPTLQLWRGVSAQVWCLGCPRGTDFVKGLLVYVDPDAPEPDYETATWRPWGPESYARTDEEAIERAWQWWDTRADEGLEIKFKTAQELGPGKGGHHDYG